MNNHPRKQQPESTSPSTSYMIIGLIDFCFSLVLALYIVDHFSLSIPFSDNMPIMDTLFASIKNLVMGFIIFVVLGIVHEVVFRLIYRHSTRPKKQS